MYASTARASFWRRRRSRSKRSVASRVSARLRQFERRFTGASARRPRSIAPSSATSRRPVDPSYPEGDLYRDFHLVEAVDVRGARTPAVAVAVEVAVLELDSHSIGRLGEEAGRRCSPRGPPAGPSRPPRGRPPSLSAKNPAPRTAQAP